MKNADMPAMPIELSGFGQFAPVAHCGLTKREIFAMHAMQGLLSDGTYAELYDSPEEWRKNVVEASVEFADELLAELEK